MSDEGRGLVCVFCGDGFGYSGQTPDEATLKAAVDHEKECRNNPYKAEIKRLQDENKGLKDSNAITAFEYGNSMAIYDGLNKRIAELEAQVERFTITRLKSGVLAQKVSQ